MYGEPSLLAALDSWEEVARAAGITKAALAYRWVAYHSAMRFERNDVVIIGASSLKQLQETLTACEEGPLEPEVVKKIQDTWKLVKDEAPIDNYHRD